MIFNPFEVKSEGFMNGSSSSSTRIRHSENENEDEDDWEIKLLKNHYGRANEIVRYFCSRMNASPKASITSPGSSVMKRLM